MSEVSMSTTREALAAALDYLERNSPANGYGLLDHDADKERREAIAKIEAAIAATPEQAPAALPSSLGVSPSGPGSTLQPAVSAAIPDAIPADPFVGVAVSDPAVWRTDPAYAQACLVVRAQKRAAISTVQRHLRIGYNRAARLLEAMVGDVIAEMPPTTKLLPARGIEREARESEGPSPKGDEPGGEATRPEQIAALTAQVEALRQDAERWRFLRAQHEGDDAESFTVFSAVEPREFALEPVGSLPGELDRIVDAAMKDKGEFGAEMQSGGNPQTQVKQGES